MEAEVSSQQQKKYKKEVLKLYTVKANYINMLNEINVIYVVKKDLHEGKLFFATEHRR